jgi:hypothetical protein
MGMELVWLCAVRGRPFLPSPHRVDSGRLWRDVRMELAVVGRMPPILLAPCSLPGRIHHRLSGKSEVADVKSKSAGRIDPFTIAKVIAVAMVLVPHIFDGSFPRGYFTLLRWIVCPVLAVIAYRAYEAKRIPWAWVFGVDAAIFNPIFPAYLRSLWPLVDCATAALLVASFFLRLRESKRP